MDVAVGVGGEGVDEVGEGGVGELVAGEVGVDAGQEVLLAEPGDELTQGGGALGVGDAVEVEEGGGGVGDGGGVRGDGVGGGALVGVVAPGLAVHAEAGPGLGEAGGFDEGLVAHELGEGLVQPDVVPPAEGDEVAEPHVGHLVRDGHGAALAFGVGDGGSEDVVVAEGDQSRVLHGAGVELGYEGLVVGVEGVGLGELLVEAVVAGGAEVEDLLRVGVEVGGEGAAAVDAEGEPGVFGADAVPGACGDGGEVGGDDGGGGGRPDAGFGGGCGAVARAVVAAAVGWAFADAGGDAVGEDGPVCGGGDGELEDGLEVGLVEGREDALDVVEEHLGVDVRLPVRGVGEAVQAFAGAGVAHAGGDAELVGALGEAGEGEAAVGEGGRVQGVSVEGGGAQFVRFQLDEGVAGGAGGEPDDGLGLEGLVAGGEVEGDLVVPDVEEPGSDLRFVARQCGHGAHAAGWWCRSRAPASIPGLRFRRRRRFRLRPRPRLRRSSRGGG